VLGLGVAVGRNGRSENLHLFGGENGSWGVGVGACVGRQNG